MVRSKEGQELEERCVLMALGDKKGGMVHSIKELREACKNNSFVRNHCPLTRFVVMGDSPLGGNRFFERQENTKRVLLRMLKKNRIHIRYGHPGYEIRSKGVMFIGKWVDITPEEFVGRVNGPMNPYDRR